ncbi:4'-phosphopantetheinyl transferase family protein [Pedobacter sp. PWIIR3]
MASSLSIGSLIRIEADIAVEQLSCSGAVHIWLISFGNDTDRKSMRTLSRSLLSQLLRKHYAFLNDSDFIFSNQPNGKPELRINGIQPLHYNISYTKGIMALAISDQPIGIDVEQVNTSFNYHEIVEGYFSSEEARLLKLQSHQHFFLLWTRKEAILKATGIGLVEQLQSVPSIDGNYFLSIEISGDNDKSWQMHSFDMNDLMLSLATPYSLEAVKLFNITF